MAADLEQVRANPLKERGTRRPLRRTSARESSFVRRETARITRHLLQAELIARAANTSRLDSIRSRVRALLLDELARYRNAQRFPRNPDFAEPTPYFVDASGTRCAMAHLLEVSGEAELVRDIARRRNNARIHELVDEPRLAAWLAAAGISVEEAALIQPSYCHRGTDCVCSSFRSDEIFEAVVIADTGEVGVLARVETVHKGTAVAPGDEVIVKNLEVPVGTPLVAQRWPENDGGIFYAATVVTEPYVCAEGLPPLTRRQYAEAISSDDCRGYLTRDPRWESNEGCSGGTMCYCAVPGGARSEPTTIGILVALLGVIAARRARSRNRRIERRSQRGGSGSR